MTDPRVLIVASSRHIEIRDGSASSWRQELALPYHAFCEFSSNIVLTSPNGITISGAGEPAGTAQNRTLSGDEHAALAWIAGSVPIGKLAPEDFDILYIAAGVNSAADMAHCRPLIAMLEAFILDEKPIAAIGLGVNVLLSLFTATGEPYIKHKRMTSLSNREVVEQGLQALMPFSLESRLIAFGAAYSSTASGCSNVVKDGMLVTGQNTASSAMAVFVLRALALEILPAGSPASHETTDSSRRRPRI